MFTPCVHPSPCSVMEEVEVLDENGLSRVVERFWGFCACSVARLEGLSGLLLVVLVAVPVCLRRECRRAKCVP